jgi:hypothetical protein
MFSMQMIAGFESQYRAALAMLHQTIERCPDELWNSGDHPRTYWRIAYHALYYTHLYLAPTLEEFIPWEKNVDHARILWDDDETGIPPTDLLYSQQDLLDYCTFIEQNLTNFLANIDFNAPTSGFSWYRIPKFEHQLVNIRHIGIHIGQLQELIYAKGIDLDWVSKR